MSLARAPLFGPFPGGTEGAIILFMLLLYVLPFLGAWWVYNDAQARGIENAELWGLGIAALFLSAIVLKIFGILLGIGGIIAYLFKTGQLQSSPEPSIDRNTNTVGSDDAQRNTEPRTNIAISEELAAELSAHKNRDESYEDVIWRLIENQNE